MEDNIKVNLKETGFEDIEGIHLAQGADKWRARVATAVNISVPMNFYTM